MKKLLALVLALVMTLGLATVGANAAATKYADADKISYKEAVDVMTAIGVLAGDETGFRPTDTLKRSEGAKIVAYLLLGNKAAEAMVGSGNRFTDLPANHWAAGYMEHLASQGVMGGVGDNKIDPDGQLTATQFAKMLLTALGYDAEIEGFGGTDWSINVQKVANKVGIFEGNATVAPNAAVTREEAALYALNTLKSPLVEYDSKINVNVAGANVTVGSSNAKYVTTEIARTQTISNKKLSNSNDYTIEFAEQYYPKLELNYGGDAFGRPSNRWLYDGKEIDWYADAPALQYTGTVKYNKIYSDLGLTDNTATEVRVDGVFDEDNVFSKANDAKVNGDQVGTLTQVYKIYRDDDGNFAHDGDNFFYRTVQIHTYVGEVDKTVAATATQDRHIVISRTNLNPPANFDATEIYETEETFEDDTIVIFNFSQANQTLYNVTVAKTVEGEVTQAQNATDDQEASRSVTVDGTKYSIAKNFGGQNEVGDVTVGGTYIIYTDAFNNAIYIEEVEALSGDYALLVAVEGVNGGGFQTNRAKLLCSDGVLRVVNTAKDYQTGSNRINVGTIVTFRNDNGTYTLKALPNAKQDATAIAEAWTNAGTANTSKIDNNADTLYYDGSTDAKTFSMTNGKAGIQVGENTVNANSNTIFVVYDQENRDVTVYTGIKNAPTIASDDGVDSGDVFANYYHRSDSPMANVMFIIAQSDDIIEGAQNKALFLAEGSASNLTHDGNDSYYEYKGVIEGKIDTIKVDYDVFGADGKTLSGFFSKYSTDSKGIITKLEGVNQVNNTVATGTTTTTNEAGYATTIRHGYTPYANNADTLGYFYGTGIAKTSADYTVTLGAGKVLVGGGAYTLTVASDAKIYYVDGDNKIEEIKYSQITVDDNDFVYAIIEDYMVQKLVIEARAATADDTSLPAATGVNMGANNAANYTVPSGIVHDPAGNLNVTGDLIVKDGGTLTLDGGNDQITGTLIVEEGGMLTIDGNVTIGQAVDIQGHVTVNGGTVLVNGADVTSTIASDNTLEMVGGTITFKGPVSITGHVSVSNGATFTANKTLTATSTASIETEGEIEVKGAVVNAGTITIGAGADVKLNTTVNSANTTTNTGVITVESTGKLAVTGAMTNSKTLTVSDEAEASFESTVKNSGTITVEGEASVSATGKVTNTGTVKVDDEATVDAPAGIANNGKMSISEEADVTATVTGTTPTGDGEATTLADAKTAAKAEIDGVTSALSDTSEYASGFDTAKSSAKTNIESAASKAAVEEVVTTFKETTVPELEETARAAYVTKVGDAIDAYANEQDENYSEVTYGTTSVAAVITELKSGLSDKTLAELVAMLTGNNLTDTATQNAITAALESAQAEAEAAAEAEALENATNKFNTAVTTYVGTALAADKFAGMEASDEAVTTQVNEKKAAMLSGKDSAGVLALLNDQELTDASKAQIDIALAGAKAAEMTEAVNAAKSAVNDEISVISAENHYSLIQSTVTGAYSDMSSTFDSDATVQAVKTHQQNIISQLTKLNANAEKVATAKGLVETAKSDGGITLANEEANTVTNDTFVLDDTKIKAVLTTTPSGVTYTPSDKSTTMSNQTISGTYTIGIAAGESQDSTIGNLSTKVTTSVASVGITATVTQ